MASSNLFLLLEESTSPEPSETPVVVVAPAPAHVAEPKHNAEHTASRWKRDSAHRSHEHQKHSSSHGSHGSHSSEHAPSRRIYSREWLLNSHKTYAAPAGFTSASPVFQAIARLPVAVSGHYNDVRPSLLHLHASDALFSAKMSNIRSSWLFLGRYDYFRELALVKPAIFPEPS